MSQNVPKCHVFAAILLLAACSSPDTITIGSKNFTENVFLGELIAQQIERTTDYRVDRRLNLGGTFLCQQALVSGEIDIYPEYTGTALTAILEEPVQRDSAAVYETVRRVYGDRFNLVWTRPFGFSNTFAVLMRAEDRPQIQTLSQLAAAAPQLRIGFNFEFLEREDGWNGLREAYGLSFQGDPVTMDLNLVYQALRAGQVDVAIGNSTHGLIQKLDLRILDDDQAFFPPYEAAPVVRQETLDRYPGLEDALNAVGGRLSDAKMQEINQALDVEQRRVEEVAAEFLESLPAPGP